jgi:Sec-independent protein translocase protein TatA
MMNFGPIKLIFTAVAALLILGPKRLPDAVRSLSRALGQLKAASHEVTQELKAELDIDETPSPRPPPRSLPPPEELRPGPRA